MQPSPPRLFLLAAYALCTRHESPHFGFGGSDFTAPFRMFSSSFWVRGVLPMTMCDKILLRLGIQRIIHDLVSIPFGPLPAQPRVLIFGSGVRLHWPVPHFLLLILGSGWYRGHPLRQQFLISSSGPAAPPHPGIRPRLPQIKFGEFVRAASCVFFASPPWSGGVVRH